MPAFVATEKINNAIGVVSPFAQFNEFRIEHTGIIREIRLWCRNIISGSDAYFGFAVNGVDQFISIADWFHPTEDDTTYTKTSLNIAVIKGQKASFYQIGGRRPNNILPMFIFETEIP